MQCVLVDGSQLLLSLSLQLMLLNGSSPPAVNWLGKFPRRIPWRRLASARCTVANGGHLNRQYPYLLPSPPLLPMLHQQLSALSHPSMQFTSQQAGATRTFQHTYAHAEEFRCRETSTACACISHTSKSLGLYRSKSLQLGIEIQQKKKPTRSCCSEFSTPLLASSPQHERSKHINYSSQSKDSISLMCVHQQDVFSFPEPLKIHKVTTLGFIRLCFCVKFFHLWLDFLRLYIYLSV